LNKNTDNNMEGQTQNINKPSAKRKVLVQWAVAVVTAILIAGFFPEVGKRLAQWIIGE